MIHLVFAVLCGAALPPEHFILELKAPPAADRVADAGGKRNRVSLALRQRPWVRAEQAAFRRTAGILDSEIVTSLDLISNALVLRIDEVRAQELARRPEVARVSRAQRVEPAMDRALNLEKVPQAWSLIGGAASAGAGVKIAIIDSGIETSHAAFQDPSLSIPDGFPLVSNSGYTAATTNKVIVARGYEALAGLPIPDAFADSTGHGTGVAMCAAGVQHLSPVGPISGVAPKAWLGAYKIFFSEDLTDEAIIAKAVEDAVADGMDVVNLSLSVGRWASPLDFNQFALGSAIERVVAMGVFVAGGAGNFGPERSTVNLLTPSELGVGASLNERVFGGPVTLEDGSSYTSIPMSGTSLDLKDPISAPLTDAHGLNPAGECVALPPQSLTGRIAVVSRGDACSYVTRLSNVAAAGAVAALVIAYPDVPEVTSVDDGDITLPAVAISLADGTEILAKLKANPGLKAAIRVDQVPMPVDANSMASFSSRGPTSRDEIRPDVTAVGRYVYTAAPGGSYKVVDGTSFATPQIAGAAAVLLAARPGLRQDQYRSLIVNTATVLRNPAGSMLPVMLQGAGLLNLSAAVSSTLTASPVSVSYGSGAKVDLSRNIAITNLAGGDDTLTLSLLSEDKLLPALSAGSLTVAAGGTAQVALKFTLANPAPGEYQGFVRVLAASGSEIRIPYWFGVPSSVTQYIKAEDRTAFGLPSFEAGAKHQLTLYYRATDAIGIPVTNPSPTIRVLSGGASIDNSAYLAGYRGLVFVYTTFDNKPGPVVLRIQSGAMSKDITVYTEIPDTPRIVLGQSGLEFPGVLAGLTKDLTFTVGNRGGPPLNVTAIKSSNPSYRVISAPSFSVARGSQQTVTVRFSPTGSGTQTGSLTLETNDPTQRTATVSLKGDGVPAAGPLVLQIDNGSFKDQIGYTDGAATAYFVNRLTPPKYPATLQNVQIYFGDRTDGLKQGASITVVAASNPGGTASLSGLSFQSTTATVGKVGSFTTVTVPSLQITSGDFVVGFMVNNPPKIYPAEQDTTAPSPGRSFTSTDGRTFSAIDAVVPGSFGIRATVVF